MKRIDNELAFLTTIIIFVFAYFIEINVIHTHVRNKYSKSPGGSSNRSSCCLLPFVVLVVVVRIIIR
jgi:hypothetical protein